jgi:chromate transporter
MSSGRLREVIAVFLKLGTIGFGGPAAHIGLMREEVVRRRRWVTDQQFLDLLGMTNLIPGPNSTEMTIHLGYVRAGWAGLVAGGVCFIAPAAALVSLAAWGYVQYGAAPQATGILYGIKPVIIAVVVQAMWGLGRTAVKSPTLGAAAIAVVVAYLAGGNEIALLLGGGGIVALVQGSRHASRLPFILLACPQVAAAALPLSSVSATLGTLFLTFLKIGAVLYGSGYVLLAFLRNDFVERLGWLTDQQLIDAVAVGQFTPGPVFTTATFIGYLVGGWPGAALATVAIFLPSFAFVALSHPLLPRVRGSRWASAFLDGVNVAALGLMAAVTWQLGRAAVVDPITGALAVAALVLLTRSSVNSAWLVIAGGLVGAASSLLTG